MSQEPTLPFAERSHAHLRLAATLSPGPRRPASGFGRRAVHTDRASHGRAVSEQAATVREEFRARRTSTAAPVAVDPELVMVLELNRPIDPDELERLGLTVLEHRSERVTVVFARDVELTRFLEASDEYAAGTRGTTAAGNERPALYESVFDAVELTRMITPEDVISVRVAELLEAYDPDHTVRVELHTWCSEDRDEALRRQADTVAAIGAAGGRISSSSLRIEAGLSMFIVDLTVGALDTMSLLDRVRWIDVLPMPVLSYPSFRAATEASLPTVVVPRPDLPVVGVIDSGVRSGHPLLGPIVASLDFIAGIPDPGDQTGHGTMVASLAVYGSLEDQLSAPTISPAARLCSVRVLNADNEFPDDRPWAEQLLEALDAVVQAGARVINLSVGDAREPYVPPRPTSVGALIDEFIRTRRVVVVVSAGNYTADELDLPSLSDNTYLQVALAGDRTGVLDPACAALALTTGALCGSPRQGVDFNLDADRLPVGLEGMASPLTRLGPGVMRAVKPELCAVGGSVAVDSLTHRVMPNSRIAHVVGAGAGDPERLLATDAGTSFAAPLVTHAALRVWGRYPSLGPNAVRALVLCSAELIEPQVDAGGPANSRRAQQRLTGYGSVSASRAESSSDHRTVMVRESQIVADGIHLYRVPVPSSFFTSGGSCAVGVALAFDPPVRATRLDYLASRLEFNVYHGASLEQVSQAYVRAVVEDDQHRAQPEAAPPPNDESDGDGQTSEDNPSSPAELSRYLLRLQPASKERSRGTNLYGRWVRKQRFDSKRGDELVIAVRSTNRWDPPGALQDYALAVALERDEGHQPIYAELSAQLEPLQEVVVELEIEP